MPVPGSSITSSRTSTSWSTSDRPGRPLAARILGLIRLGHPFPSLLNALVTVGLVLLAGGTVPTAARLGAAMLALQVAIGAVNDIVDASDDARGKPSKPIPSRLVTDREAGLVAAAGVVLGVGLSVASGPLVAGVAIVGAGCGFAYDLWFKRSRLSWLPLALALPLVPVYAWLGAGAGLPPGATALVPAAVLAGAALALSNALADRQADRAAGLATVVGRVGPGRAWLLHALLIASAMILALGVLVLVGGRGLGIALAWGSALVVGLGSVLVLSTARRAAQVGWSLEAVGVAGLGIGWVAAMASASGG